MSSENGVCEEAALGGFSIKESFDAVSAQIGLPAGTGPQHAGDERGIEHSLFDWGGKGQGGASSSVCLRSGTFYDKL